MIKHYFKISIRSIWRDKGYSAINIVGLAVAVACCLLLIFWIKHETSYENCYTNADRIYRVLEVEERETGKYHNTWIRPGVYSQLKKQFPQIESAVFHRSEDLDLVVVGREMKDGIISTVVTSNKDYLTMFDYVYLEGSPESIAEHGGVIINKECAQKFFGNQSPIGETLSFGASFNYTIAAVVEMAQNTHIKFDVLNIDEATSSTLLK